MMRNVNSLLREFHSNFNRFLIVIVESQFTFHYRDKWLEMNSQNLLSIKNTKSYFLSLLLCGGNSLELPYFMGKSFWDANNKKRLPGSEGITDFVLPFGRDSRREKIEKWFWSKIKGISDANLFCLHDCLKWLAQQSETIEKRWIYWISPRNPLSFSSLHRRWQKWKKWGESNDYCVMW